MSEECILIEEIDNKENSSIQIDIVENEIQPSIEPENEKPRLCWADCLRIYSMFNIIFLHSANHSYEKALAVTKNRNVIYVCIYNTITRFAVPVFVMISGMFFLNPNKKFSLSRLVKKNILRLVTAFNFWSAINAFINVVRPKTRPSILSSEFIKQFSIYFFQGEEYLWFILMIMGCYLCIPILRRISDDKALMRYFLGLWIVWGSIIPTVTDILNMTSAKTVTTVFTVWISRWHFHFTLEFIGYFAAGYYLYKYVNIEKLKHRIILYILGFVDLIVIIAVCITFDIKNNYIFTLLRENMATTNVFYSCVIFIFFKYEIGRIHFSKKAYKIITKVSSLTFGMYLSHMVVRNILFNEINFAHDHIGNNIHYSPVFGIPLLFIIVSCVCLLISYTISCIPILKKYII